MLGTFVLSSGYRDAYYKKALRVRTEIIEDYNTIFRQCDCLLSPASPTPAWKLGEKRSDPTEMYSADIFTVPVNIAGLPALSCPAAKQHRSAHRASAYRSASFGGSAVPGRPCP